MEKVFVTIENEDRTKKVEVNIGIDREAGNMDCNFVFTPPIDREDDSEVEEYQHIAGLIFQKLSED